MLVDNKFLFLSIPRCASHSFVVGCGINGIKHNYVSNKATFVYNNINWKNDFYLHDIYHPHESLLELEKKFGNNYEIISIQRNRYNRFISLWNHTLMTLKMSGDIINFEKMKKLKLDDVLYFKSKDLYNFDDLINDFILRNNLSTKNQNLKNNIDILFSPTSFFHNFDKRIIWFQIGDLKNLNEWVSDKLNINFKIAHINSSKNIKSKIKMSDKFIRKYNFIYDEFDYNKKEKTLL
jgi:hypothetical protein